MAQHGSIVLAVAALHYLLRISVFFEPLTDASSAAPSMGLLSSLAGTLVLIAIGMLLLDGFGNDDDCAGTSLCPRRYRQRLSPWPRRLVETTIAFVLLEFGMIVIWSRLELVVQAAVRCLLLGRYSAGRWPTVAEADTMAGWLSVAVASAILWNTALVTGNWCKMRRTVDWCRQLVEQRIHGKAATMVEAPMCCCQPEETTTTTRGGRKQMQQPYECQGQQQPAATNSFTAAAAAAVSARVIKQSESMRQSSGGACEHGGGITTRSRSKSRQRNRKYVCLMCEEQD